MVVQCMDQITVAISLIMMDTLHKMESTILQGGVNMGDNKAVVTEIMTILVIIMELIVGSDMDHNQDIQMTYITMKEREGMFIVISCKSSSRKANVRLSVSQSVTTNIFNL